MAKMHPKLKELKQLKDEYTKALRKDGEKILKVVFKEFFDENPNIHGVRWSQYTPYFNDGEACTFGVNEMNAVDEEGDEVEIPWRDSERTKEHRAIEKALSDLSDQIVDDDLMLAVFGDHAEITATRDGFSVDSYDHE